MRKIILTETQMKYIIKESLNSPSMIDESVISDIGDYLINTGKNVYQNMRDKVLRDFRACKTVNDCIRTLVKYISIGAISVMFAHNIIMRTFPESSQEVIQKLDTELKNNVNTKDTQLHKKRVEEVDKLMKYVAELNGRSNLLNLSAENIVTLCEKYNYPLPLLLAQAHIESHFGTTPRAQRTNSVFSVGSYDNGKNVCKYDTKDESVESYIKLMLRDYLKGKTVDELLTPGGFVNPLGNRYSSNKNYEREVKATMDGIVKKFCPSCF